MSFETISVIGLGYIGLPTAAMFASRGKKVIGVDVNLETVNIINQGETHIVEPELDALVYTAVKQGFLRAVQKPEMADAFLIAVPTPFSTDSKNIPEPDLTFIETAANSISKVLKKGDLVILESTCPVGATEKLAEWLSTARPDLSFPKYEADDADISIAHCPERVLPGQVVRELVQNDRVIGGLSSKCSKKAIELYKIFVEGDCVVTNSRTAEMAKLTENSCRDVQIAFANELSMICDELNIDVWELISLANRHPRVNILQPGPGVGGHCVAVDPWFIVGKSPDTSRLIHTARKVNDLKPNWVVEKVVSAVNELLELDKVKKEEDIVIACYGLTFKQDIDDLRESPSMEIVRKISDIHAGKVLAVEPNVAIVSSEEKFELVELEYANENADVTVFLVNHKEFLSLDLTKTKKIIDMKGICR